MALSPQERSRRMRLNMLMAMSYAVAGRTTFTPLSLFSAGEQGAWYDPSDFSTMFQDSAGTTPVTAVEQPVGLIRDKSGRGNHASQTTSTSRPVLSARVNLLTYTEDFRNTAAAGETRPWTYTGSSITVNSAVAPNGTSTANTLTEDSTAASSHRVASALTTPTASSRFSCYMKRNTRDYGALGLNTGEGAIFNLANGTISDTTGSPSAQITSVGNGWYLCSIAATATGLTCRIGMNDAATAASWSFGMPIYNGNGSGSIYIWGADLRIAGQTGLPPYQRVGAATAGTSSAAGTGDYDTTNFPLYLRWDGTDDGMVTGAINFSATDKMAVFAGVRKLSDAVAYGIVAELSASSGSVNKGSFVVAAPGSTTGTYFCGCIGSTNVSNTSSSYDLSTYTAPTTNVLSVSFNVNTADRADQIIPRVNAVTPTLSGGANSVQTGVFSSYPLYIGRRGGTSLPFNGHLYGLVVVGRALTSTEITNIETWLNTKTKAF